MVVQIRIFSLLFGVGCRNRDRIAKAFGYEKADHFRYLLAKTTWNLARKKPIPIPMPTQTPNKERLTNSQQDKILICTTIGFEIRPYKITGEKAFKKFRFTLSCNHWENEQLPQIP